MSPTDIRPDGSKRVTATDVLKDLRAWFSPASATGAAFLTLAIEARRKLSKAQFDVLREELLDEIGDVSELDHHQLEELSELAIVARFSQAFQGGIENITRDCVDGVETPSFADLRASHAELEATLDRARAEITDLQKCLGAAQNRIDELEKQTVTTGTAAPPPPLPVPGPGRPRTK